MSDDLTWIKGSHSFRFGWEGRWYYYNRGRSAGHRKLHVQQRGRRAARLQDEHRLHIRSLPARRGAQCTGLGIPAVTNGTRSRVYGVYFQDDWKVRSNLTINMGIRWDIPTALTEVRQRQSGLDPTLPNPGADGYPGALTFLGTCAGCNGKGRFADPYYKQFSPRLGFAWTPAKSGNKMVVRGGYGINYAPPIQDGWNYSYGTGFNGSNPIPAYSRGRFTEEASYNWDNPYPPYTATLPNTDPSQLNGLGHFLVYAKPHQVSHGS